MKPKKRSFSIAPFAVAAVAAGGYAGLKYLLNLKEGADEGFFDWTGPSQRGVDVGSAIIDLPVMYYRDDTFLGVFSAAYEPVKALLPSDDLFPVALPDGRATVLVAAFNYLETSGGAYGEIGINVPCTYGRTPPPLLPLILEDKYPGFGMFVVHLPVTARVARDGGREIWGFAKFVADMDFEKRPAYQRVRLSEGDSHILTLTVQQRGVSVRDNRPIITYTVRDGQLIKTTLPSRGVYQLGLTPGSGVLELGDHEIAGQLRELDLSTTALITRNYLYRSGILPAGEVIGVAERPHEGFRGVDRDFGRYTVSYDDAGPVIDLNARQLAIMGAEAGG